VLITTTGVSTETEFSTIYYYIVAFFNLAVKQADYN